VGGQRHAPAALPPGKTRYPLYRRLGGPQGRPGRVRKISPPTGIRSPDRPARSKSLYRLSYPGPHCEVNTLCSEFTAGVKIAIFWVVTTCSCTKKNTDVSEKRITSVVCSDGGGDRFFETSVDYYPIVRAHIPFLYFTFC
jgi:hypothetical protein